MSREMAITIPLKPGGAEAIRALRDLSIEKEMRSTEVLASHTAGLWLQVTRRGEERAIYYYHLHSQDDAHGNEIPPLEADVATAIDSVAVDGFRMDGVETQLLYSWDSPEFDESTRYDTGACALAVSPEATGSIDADAKVFGDLSAYSSALDEAGFRRVRNWFQTGPGDHFFLTIYNNAVDLRAAFHAWQTMAPPVDQWTRNKVRSMSNDDAELWENLLAVEHILSWTPIDRD